MGALWPNSGDGPYWVWHNSTGHFKWLWKIKISGAWFGSVQTKVPVEKPHMSQIGNNFGD